MCHYCFASTGALHAFYEEMKINTLIAVNSEKGSEQWHISLSTGMAVVQLLFSGLHSTIATC